MVDLLMPRGYATSFAADDIRRMGCKIRQNPDNGPSIGSGLNTEYGVVTCWHCVSRGGPIEVECDGELAQGTVIARDDANDVALISVPWKQSHPFARLSSGKAVGKVSYVGRGIDGLILTSPAEVTGETFDGLPIVSPPTFAGQSGAGYVDANGDLVGIVSGNITKPEPFRGLMIPVDVIRSIIPVGAVRQAKAIPVEASPTPHAEIVRVLGLLAKPKIGFVEFGCGADARWCVAAVQKWKCRATGIEIDHDRAIAAQDHVRAIGLSDFITIVEGDAIVTNATADVGVAYLYDDVLRKLSPRIEKLQSFASYMHRPAVPTIQNGDSWIYSKGAVFATPVQQRMAVWQGQQYAGPVCSNPRCAMCNSIRAQLGR